MPPYVVNSRKSEATARSKNMIETGKNSYITIAEADDIISRLCVLDSSTAYWDALEDDQKTAFLEQSYREIELTPKVGHKVHPYQAQEYPRRANFLRVEDIYAIPQEIKEAQAVNALALMNIRLGKPRDGFHLSSTRADELMRLWFYGGF